LFNFSIHPLDYLRTFQPKRVHCCLVQLQKITDNVHVSNHTRDVKPTTVSSNDSTSPRPHIQSLKIKTFFIDRSGLLEIVIELSWREIDFFSSIHSLQQAAEAKTFFLLSLSFE
jgi:hypothetical protein